MQGLYGMGSMGYEFVLSSVFWLTEWSPYLTYIQCNWHNVTVKNLAKDFGIYIMENYFDSIESSVSVFFQHVHCHVKVS